MPRVFRCWRTLESKVLANAERSTSFLRFETGQRSGMALGASLDLLLDEVITFRDLIVDQLDFYC